MFLILAAVFIFVACDKPDDIQEIPDASYSGKIAFISDRDGARDLFLMDGDGSNQINLTNQEMDWVSDPVFSPDGNLIVFNQRKDSKSDIGLVDLSTYEVVNLTSEAAYNGSPQFSEGGSKIYYISDYSNLFGHPGGLFQMDIDGSAVEMLVDSVSNFQLNSDRSRFLTIDQPGIWVMNIDGSERLKLVEEWVWNIQFSPDGTEVLYVAKPDHVYNVYKIDSSGDNSPVLIVNDLHAGFLHKLQFSPDGSKIVYIGHTEASPDVFTMNVDGSEQHRLIQIDGGEDSPSYSPDGSLIIFSASLFYHGEIAEDIFLVNNDGSGLVNLTNSESMDIFPVFQPMP